MARSGPFGASGCRLIFNIHAKFREIPREQVTILDQRDVQIRGAALHHPLHDALGEAERHPPARQRARCIHGSEETRLRTQAITSG